MRQLAQRFGIPIPELEATEEGRESAAEREALLRMHEVAAAYFREQLESPAGARIREYLLRRARPDARDHRRRSVWGLPLRRAMDCASGC